MPQDAKGSVFRRSGRLIGVRVSMPGGARPLVRFDEALRDRPELLARIETLSESELDLLARMVSDDYRARHCVPKGTPETVNEYSTRWLKSRDGKIASVRDNKGHLNEHILPVLGLDEMGRVTSKRIEDLVAALDKKVAAGALSAKTAKNIWGTCTKMFDDATHAKPHTGLRCLEKDPTDGVRGPDDDEADKLLQFLYPSEFLTFVECERVPLAWRRNVAIAVYLCLRDGEQRALKWSAVDLEHGLVTIAETFDRRKGEDREGTKSGAARVVPIRPELVPLLATMREEAGGDEATGLVCTGLPTLQNAAHDLRRFLRKAGVDRDALHKTTTVSKQLRWHDLRATGLTWMAVEGRSPTEIRDVAGHTQTSMTDRYMRSAGILRGGRFGDVFPPLPPLEKKLDPKLDPNQLFPAQLRGTTVRRTGVECADFRGKQPRNRFIRRRRRFDERDRGRTRRDVGRVDCSRGPLERCGSGRRRAPRPARAGDRRAAVDGRRALRRCARRADRDGGRGAPVRAP